MIVVIKMLCEHTIGHTVFSDVLESVLYKLPVYPEQILKFRIARE